MPDQIPLPDGSWLGYQIIGTGPCHVVMLHGFAANHGTWFDLTPFFAEEQYTLHLLDLPPHGVAGRNTHDHRQLRTQPA
jgi:pimeloyl-ACP methyl ester carboxylesterase